MPPHRSWASSWIAARYEEPISPSRSVREQPANRAGDSLDLPRRAATTWRAVLARGHEDRAAAGGAVEPESRSAARHRWMPRWAPPHWCSALCANGRCAHPAPTCSPLAPAAAMLQGSRRASIPQQRWKLDERPMPPRVRPRECACRLTVTPLGQRCRVRVSLYDQSRATDRPDPLGQTWSAPVATTSERQRGRCARTSHGPSPSRPALTLLLASLRTDTIDRESEAEPMDIDPYVELRRCQSRGASEQLNERAMVRAHGVPRRPAVPRFGVLCGFNPPKQ